LVEIIILATVEILTPEHFIGLQSLASVAVQSGSRLPRIDNSVFDETEMIILALVEIFRE
jgi:hypothetical protein